MGATIYFIASALLLLVVLQHMRTWRGQLDLFLLWVAVLLSAAWAFTNGLLWPSGSPDLAFSNYAEYLRYAAWTVFSIHVIAAQSPAYRDGLRSLAFPLGLAGCGFASSVVATVFVTDSTAGGLASDAAHVNTASLLLCASGLMLMTRRLWLGVVAAQRPRFVMLAVGITIMLSGDIAVFAAQLLGNDTSFLSAIRGVTTGLAAPFFFRAVQSSSWSRAAHLSHSAVFVVSMTVVALAYFALIAVLALLIPSGWIDEHGAARLLFVVFGVAMLTLLYVSEPHRAQLKVLLNKHFFNYKYDYRDEWLRFIRTLSRGGPGAHLLETVVQALAQIVGSRNGTLWLQTEVGRYDLAAAVDTPRPAENREPADGSLVRFLKTWQWVINIEEYGADPELYQELTLPPWINDMPRAWLIVPLMQDVELLGFVVIDRPASAHTINWEDHDLLKTAGRQAATHLAQLMAVQALVEAREFQAFSRLSAFVIHDLKNLVAQLSLVVSNAAKHKHNPEFMEDAIGTVRNSVDKMNRLLGQLRKGKAQPTKGTVLNVATLLREVIAERQDQEPRPSLDTGSSTGNIAADPDRMSAVFTHLIQNAQEACAADGWVRVKVHDQDRRVAIEIADNGCGMDANFIRDRLFRPFDSTKGHGGMGIGAFESREYVRELGGDIHVTSEPGKGSLFVVTLPLANANAAIPSPALQREPGPPITTVTERMRGTP